MGNWDLEAVEASEVAEAADVNEAEEVIMLGKSLLRTSESSRFLNSIFQGLYLNVLK